VFTWRNERDADTAKANNVIISKFNVNKSSTKRENKLFTTSKWRAEEKNIINQIITQRKKWYCRTGLIFEIKSVRL